MSRIQEKQQCSKFSGVDRCSANELSQHSATGLSELHWLDVLETVTYKLGAMMYRCLHGQTPRYLADHLITASDVASRLRLHSAN